jgi:putative restriction endonuclease
VDITEENSAGAMVVKGVFDTSASSRYKDDAASQYHFPKLYRQRVERLIGGWIVYRVPRVAGGSMGYIAAARVEAVVPDEEDPSHFYALMSDYTPFDKTVPFSVNGRYAEQILRDLSNRSDVGRTLQGHSVRELSEEDFAAIVRSGLSETLDASNARRLNLDRTTLDTDTRELLDAPLVEQERRIEQILLNRKVRDANFRRAVCAAYEDTCAVTGIRVINGGGRAEVQAAHIWPVADGGPDVVQNGIALSGTIHWLFDRHLISIDETYRLHISHNKVPSELRSLFAYQGERMRPPKDPALHPNPAYLTRHMAAFGGSN